MLCRVTTRGLAIYVYGFADRDEVVARVGRFAAAVHDAAVVRRNRTHAGLALKMGLPAAVVCMPCPRGWVSDRSVDRAVFVARSCSLARAHVRTNARARAHFRSAEARAETRLTHASPQVASIHAHTYLASPRGAADGDGADLEEEGEGGEGEHDASPLGIYHLGLVRPPRSTPRTGGGSLAALCRLLGSLGCSVVPQQGLLGATASAAGGQGDPYLMHGLALHVSAPVASTSAAIADARARRARDGGRGAGGLRLLAVLCRKPAMEFVVPLRSAAEVRRRVCVDASV